MDAFDAIHRHCDGSYTAFVDEEKEQTYENGCWISRLDVQENHDEEVIIVAHGTKEGAIVFEHHAVFHLEELVTRARWLVPDVARVYLVVCFPNRVRDAYRNVESSIPIEILGDWDGLTYSREYPRYYEFNNA